MPVTSLVTLDEARAHLELEDDSDDIELADFIDRAAPIIEDVTGPIIARTITGEQHPGGGTVICVHQRPVLTIESVKEFYGKTAFTVSQTPDPTTATTYSYTFDAAKGALTRRNQAGYPWPWGLNGGVVYVNYTAGRATVPVNVIGGTLDLLAFMWETQRGGSSGRPVAGNTGELTPTPSGYLVPARVLEALAPSQRLTTFA